MKKIGAIFLRDFQSEVSYKTAFIIQFMAIILTVLLWYFVARFIGDAVSVDLAGRKVDYFSFVLIGIAAMRFFHTATTSFSTRLRNEQLTGTLEAMIVTPTSIPVIILSWASWDFFVALVNIIIIIAAGTLFFGMNISLSGLPAFAVVLTLTVAALSTVGILSASFIMVLKRGDPVNFFLSNTFALLGGVFFPLEVLPEWLRIVARALPAPWALDALRKSLLNGVGITEIYREIFILAGFTIVLMPLSLLAFRYALDRARRDGTLVQY